MREREREEGVHAYHTSPTASCPGVNGIEAIVLATVKVTHQYYNNYSIVCFHGLMHITHVHVHVHVHIYIINYEL